MTAAVRIVVVDGHPVMRRGLVTALGEMSGFEVVGAHDHALDAVRRYEVEQPDIVVMDHIPAVVGVDPGRELCRRCRVVVFTSLPTDSTVLGVLAVGVSGFVTKESKPSALPDAVRCVASGGTYIDPRVAGKVVAAALNGRGEPVRKFGA